MRAGRARVRATEAGRARDTGRRGGRRTLWAGGPRAAVRAGGRTEEHRLCRWITDRLVKNYLGDVATPHVKEIAINDV